MWQQMEYVSEMPLADESNSGLLGVVDGILSIAIIVMARLDVTSPVLFILSVLQCPYVACVCNTPNVYTPHNS